MSIPPIFPLFVDWEVDTLGELTKRGGGRIQTGPFGSQLHASDYVEKGIPSIMPQNISSDRISDEGIARITEADASRLSKYRVHTGDVVYSRRGDVERRALVRPENDGWLCGTGCLKVSFGKGIVDSEYAAFYLSHPASKAWVVQHAVGATMPNLNTSILAALPFVLPPMKDQKLIVSILASLDDKIELNRQMNAVLEGMARAVFVDWFVDFGPTRRKMAGEADPVKILGGAIRPPTQAQKTAALFPDRLGQNGLPEGWQEVLLGDFSVIKQGKYRRDFSDIPTEKESVPLYGGNGIRGFVKEADNRLSVTYITCRGSGCGLVQRPKRASSFTNSLISLSASHSDFFSTYLYYASKRMRFSSVTTGSAQPQITIGNIRTLPIVHPKDDLMVAFSELLFPNFELQIILEEENQTLAEMRDLLLPKLMSGEIRLREAE